MKKFFTMLCALLTCVCFCFAFAACEKDTPKDETNTEPPAQETPTEEVTEGDDDKKDENGEEVEEPKPIFPENFENSFTESFEHKCLDDGAVPQGLGTYSVTYETLNEDGNNKSISQQFFFISAIMTDGSPSRIYVIGENDGYIGYVTASTSLGTPFTGKFSGLAINSKTLWVGCGNKIYVAKASKQYNDNIAYEIVKKATNNGKINFTANFNANCNVSFLYYFDDSRYNSMTYDRLYVGGTSIQSSLTTPGRYKNTAFMYEYNVSSSTENEYGLITIFDESLESENLVPKIQRLYSLPENIQGIAFSGRTGYGTNDGILVLSERNEEDYSHLLCFDWQKINSSTNYVQYGFLYETGFQYEGIYTTINGKQVTYNDSSLCVYYVDKGNEEMFINNYTVPQFSSALCVVTRSGANESAAKKVYVMFENLAYVYTFIPHEK